MVSSGTIRHLGFTCICSIYVIAALTMPKAAQAQNPDSALPEDAIELQPNATDAPALPEGSGQQQLDLTDPNNMRPLTQNDSLLSLQGGQRLMEEASSAIDGQDYALAAKKLQDARQIFNQLSNFYQQLASSFSGIENRIYDAQRLKALETAEMRDEATYQLALVHRAQNQPELAVPLLIQIIRSQNPTRDLGKKAYQQLFEIGFVDSPYPVPRNGQSTSSNTSGN
ncbi:MAG: hypothetical protein F6K36_11585 [Symploca sp. SIO3C6]|uniref:Tetratricopeptide repeat protein n=1 Tax=Symploca sp. SIO1C4 TaxID=2607765 RepID=A0A6B3N0B5_9CYAN|nr:hypothetical protein [Symploca sp. SIO3C6]NER27126.1 hypothetical protein [Symploca sp. SIO1C4]NET07971.1 hypothetical protein [Symploca sp. SIO2B6]